MTITHIGKIGRLHKCTRDQLGHRIEDGEPGKDLVQWLNDSADVQKILKEQFGGRAITEQNLSEWRQTGHPEWLRQEETHLLAASLTEQSDDLNEAAKGQELSDRFASVLAMEMARLATLLMDKETDPEKRWQRLCQVSRELSRLRRDDHRATRTLIERQRWQRQMKSEDEESDKRQPSCRPRALTRRTCGRGDEEQPGRLDGQDVRKQPNTSPEQTSSVLISAIRVCPEQPGGRLRSNKIQVNPG